MSLDAAVPPVCPLAFSSTKNPHPQDNRGLCALPPCAADTGDMHLPFAPSFWKHLPGGARTPTPLCLTALL